MDTFRVLISCKLGQAAMTRFSAEPGFETVVMELRDEEALSKVVGGFHALIVRSNVRVTDKVLAAGTDLVAVGRAGIGVDNIDVESATRRGVAVLNAPSGNIVTTAEHALALLFSLARNVPQANRSMKDRRWEKNKFMGRELRGKTLGVLGAGRVGSAVAERALALKMQVIVCDPFLSDERAAKLRVERVGFDEFLARADFLTVHTPLNDETRGLIDADALAKCKPGLLLVNCARGGIVDEDALLFSIEAGRVAGAALDVFEEEPPPPHPLYDKDEVVLTPHLGASTVEAQENVAVEIAENVIQYLLCGTAANLVNAPPATLETLGAVGPYVTLAGSMGCFAAQIVDGPTARARVSWWGEAPSAEGMDLVTAGFLKGFLSPLLAARVNLVNARSVAAERGMRVETSTVAESRDYANLLSVEISGPWGTHLLEGTVFGAGTLRLVRLDDYQLDAVPKGNLILIYNDDVPGVIGGVGLCLGRFGVNIAGMYNGRKAVGGEALSLVNVDQPPGEEVLEALRGLPHVRSARLLKC